MELRDEEGSSSPAASGQGASAEVRVSSRAGGGGRQRLFGLSNGEGNHGEDVKECYFYLDATPTHSYMKYLYKCPQGAFPYDDPVATNRGRGKPEYELLDTGVFDRRRKKPRRAGRGLLCNE
jgi:hypothetical protein